MKEDRFLFFGSHAEYKFLLGDLTLGLTFIGLVVASLFVSPVNIPIKFNDSSYWSIVLILLFVSVPIGLAVSELSLMTFSEIIYSYSLSLFRKITKNDRLCMSLIRNNIVCRFLREFSSKDKGEYFFNFLGLYQRYIKDEGIMDFTAKNVSRASGMRVYFRGVAFSALISLTILCGSSIDEVGGFEIFVICVASIFIVLYFSFLLSETRRLIFNLIFKNRFLIWLVSLSVLVMPWVLSTYSKFISYYIVLTAIIVLSIIASAFADVYSKIHIVKGVIGYFLTTGSWPEYWPENWRIWRSIDEVYRKTETGSRGGEGQDR